MFEHFHNYPLPQTISRAYFLTTLYHSYLDVATDQECLDHLIKFDVWIPSISRCGFFFASDDWWKNKSALFHFLRSLIVWCEAPLLILMTGIGIGSRSHESKSFKNCCPVMKTLFSPTRSGRWNRGMKSRRGSEGNEDPVVVGVDVTKVALARRRSFFEIVKSRKKLHTIFQKSKLCTDRGLIYAQQ